MSAVSRGWGFTAAERTLGALVAPAGCPRDQRRANIISPDLIDGFFRIPNVGEQEWFFQRTSASAYESRRTSLP